MKASLGWEERTLACDKMYLLTASDAISSSVFTLAGGAGAAPWIFNSGAHRFADRKKHDEETLKDQKAPPTSEMNTSTVTNASQTTGREETLREAMAF